MKVSNRWLALAVPLSLAAAPVAAQSDIAAAEEAYVEAAWPADGPGGAAIITRGGEVVYSGAHGLADVAAGRPLTVDSVFRFGSISKQFTAALVLMLAEDGKLSLDDPLRKFLPGYPQPAGDATVRQLLNHTSGIRSFTSLPGAMTEAMTSRSYTTADIVALIRDEPLDFAAGSRFSYNNSGYALLAAIVEAVTGQPWQVMLEQRITRPLGLATIRYAPDEDALANRALPYSAGPEGVKPAQKVHLSSASGAGGLVGSVRDLARWAQALHHGKVVSAASYAAMIAPTRLPDGSTVPYGFGLMTEKLQGFALIGHNGGIQGGLTDSLYLPEQDLFVAVFVNSDRPQVLPGIAARRLAALAVGRPLPEFQPIALDPAALEPLLGVYAGDGVEGRVYLRDGRLFTQTGDEPERPVLAAGGDRFFYGPNSFAWFEVHRGGAGPVTAELHPNGSDEVVRLTRTGPIPSPVVPRAVLERYVGRYELNGTIATIGLTADDRLTVQLTDQPLGPPLRTISASEFAGDSAGVRVTFEGEGPKATVIRSRYAGNEVTGTRLPDAPQPVGPPPVDETLAPYVSTADSIELPDGRMLHFVCMGEGSPTVILSAGLGDFAGAAWSTVQPEMAKITRVCSWDRPGFGLSDGTAAPVDVVTTSADLEAALATGRVPGPYVMVGHSFGSYESLLFADRHPDSVVGMVLVDPSIPDQAARLQPSRPAPDPTQNPMVQLFRRCAAAIRAGTAKANGPDPDHCFDYPPTWPLALRQALVAKAGNPVQYETMASFAVGSANGSKQVINPSRNYRDMPLIVLSAGDRLQPPPGASPPPLTDEQKAAQAAMEEAFNRGQEELATLSTRGENTRVPGANHYIQRTKPQAVLDAVAKVVSEARASSR